MENSGEQKISDLWKRMLEHGFVHATGLITYKKNEPHVPVYIFPHPKLMHSTTARRNGDMVAAQLPDGSVWIRFGWIDFRQIPMLDGFEHGGLFVPCSNGESIDGRLILARVQNPLWNGGHAQIPVNNEAPIDLRHYRYPPTRADLEIHPDYKKFFDAANK